MNLPRSMLPKTAIGDLDFNPKADATVKTFKIFKTGSTKKPLAQNCPKPDVTIIFAQLRKTGNFQVLFLTLH